MDRLLTPNEQPNIPQDTFSIYDWKTALQIESYINEVKKLQDSKTASLVAQEIFKDLNKYRFAEPQYIAEAGREPVIICLTENDIQAIKSKWGIEC